MVFTKRKSDSGAMLKFVLAVALCLVFSACRKTDKHAEYKIGFSQCTGFDLWRRTMLDEMKMELSFHPGTQFTYADAGGNSARQVAQVQKMLRDGIDLLIISPNEAQPLTGVVEQAYNKGIPVIVIDRKTSSNLYTAYVGSDNYQIGRMAGLYMGGLLNGHGNIVEVMGLPGSSPAIERERGFRDGLARFPGLQITAKIYGDWEKDTAKSRLNAILLQLQNADAVFAHNDVMALGVNQVIGRLPAIRHQKIVGVDALPGSGGGLQMVASRVIDASVLYPTGGKEAIATAFRILNKEPFQRENILESLVIDPGNVTLMKLQWNKINSQQKDIERQQNLLEEQRTVYKSQQIILNIVIITLVLSVVFGGLAFFSLIENRKINKSLEAKNAEILKQRNQLIEMSAKAEAATEAKLNFFTNISHEFRTPLTLILSPIEDMMRNEKLTAVNGKGLRLIHKNIFRLLRLVNQLIDYRKIEYDKQKLQVSQNDLIPYVTDIMGCFREAARKRNISLTLTNDPGPIMVWFDTELLDKVFFNLIANALKFSNNNGRISIIIQQDERNVIIAIADNGIGMNADDLEHMFELFYQADQNAMKGSGLGLALSKEIVELHHGTINAVSARWQGTTFTITLPLGNAHFDGNIVNRDIKTYAGAAENARYYLTDLDETPVLPLTDALAAPRDYSVLVIEDNADLLNYLAEKLGTEFEIFTADNGEFGISETFDRVPDLIISDVVLPGMSGRELSNKLKNDIRTSHIPIILLTAQSNLEQQLAGITSMADAYITKPFNYDHLLATIRNLIANRKLLKDHYTTGIETEKLPVAKTLDKKFINDFKGIVEQNLANENFSVDDICKQIGVSRIQLYRKVKALLGCSISDYILNRRLKKAKYLLLNEHYSISEITYMVGFSTPNYFSTVFKAKYGSTPTEYKKSQAS